MLPYVHFLTRPVCCEDSNEHSGYANGADSLGEDSKWVLRKIFGPKRDEVKENKGGEDYIKKRYGFAYHQILFE
jgi:hypothetical protein